MHLNYNLNKIKLFFIIRASCWESMGEEVRLFSEFNKDAALIYLPCPYILIARKSGASLLYSEYRRCALQQGFAVFL